MSIVSNKRPIGSKNLEINKSNKVIVKTLQKSVIQILHSIISPLNISELEVNEIELFVELQTICEEQFKLFSSMQEKVSKGYNLERDEKGSYIISKKNPKFKEIIKKMYSLTEQPIKIDFTSGGKESCVNFIEKTSFYEYCKIWKLSIEQVKFIKSFLVKGEEIEEYIKKEI